MQTLVSLGCQERHYTYAAFCLRHSGILPGLLTPGRMAGKDFGHVQQKLWHLVQQIRLHIEFD